ncbi:MAG TPA: tetratricopeptide repeat protein [Saprospiraceae bacterium]|nr:tetratricopeptide repeat protein [Saprospiraceae bacterium]
MRSLIFFFIFLLPGSGLQAQSHSDTLALARELKSQGELKNASRLLEAWTLSHPRDMQAFWLFAQTAFWRKKFDHSIRLYKKAISLEDHNLYLKLDFAEQLLQLGRINAARKILDGLNDQEKNDPHAQYLQARRLYGSGKLKSAHHLANRAVQSGSMAAPGLLKEIHSLRTPWLTLDGQYDHDSQPLDQLQSSLSIGRYHSNWLDWNTGLRHQRFDADSVSANTTSWYAGNRFHFPRTGTSFGINGGLHVSKNEKTNGIYQFDFTQKLPMFFQFSAAFSEKPYRNTSSSIDTFIPWKQAQFALEWRHPMEIWIKAGGQVDRFSDHKGLRSWWAWALSPPLKNNWFNGCIGYAFSLANAEDSRFTSVKSLDQLLNPWDSTADIKGYYHPYFTPKDMTIHNALLLLEGRSKKGIHLTLRGSYGIHASTQNPYLFLDKDENGSLFIARGFHKTKFNPFECHLSARIPLHSHLNLEASYRFARIFFYDLHSAAVRLNFIF